MTEINDGWILTYFTNYPISLDEYKQLLETFAVRGEYVKYTGKNGYESDKTHASKFFYEGQILRVDTCEIGNSSSTYSFQECPDSRFNTVMFEKIQVTP